MLRLLSSKAQGRKDFRKPSKPCHVCIHWIALVEYSKMSTHVPGFQSFFRFLLHFVLASSIWETLLLWITEKVPIYNNSQITYQQNTPYTQCHLRCLVQGCSALPAYLLCGVWGKRLKHLSSSASWGIRGLSLPQANTWKEAVFKLTQ